MTLQLPAPFLRVNVEPLLQSSFSPYGTVIENPACSKSGFEQGNVPAELQAVPANQMTALKYPNVSRVDDLYRHAPSQRKAVPVTNLFVCKPRRLRVADLDHSSISVENKCTENVFDVNILERHPFTSQTFIPMGLCSADQTTRYLVMVAPAVPGPTRMGTRWPEPESPRIASCLWPPQQWERQVASEPGMPDLPNIKAFLADGSQAITYSAGTWHAPMVVIGEKEIVFVVSQLANGISEEDCQEIELRPASHSGVRVAVPILNTYDRQASKI